MSYYSRIEMTVKGDAKEIYEDFVRLSNDCEDESFYNLFNGYDGMFRYALGEFEYEVKTSRKKAKRFLVNGDCNHFGYLMETEWLDDLKRYSLRFPSSVFTIHQKTEDDSYFEYEIANGKAKKREMIVVLKGKEWEEI